jgi:ABC-type metal ion transport system substrate-binding protein
MLALETADAAQQARALALAQQTGLVVLTVPASEDLAPA